MIIMQKSFSNECTHRGQATREVNNTFQIIWAEDTAYHLQAELNSQESCLQLTDYQGRMLAVEGTLPHASRQQCCFCQHYALSP